jgi:hypothetical protein
MLSAATSAVTRSNPNIGTILWSAPAGPAPWTVGTIISEDVLRKTAVILIFQQLLAPIAKTPI